MAASSLSGAYLASTSHACEEGAPAALAPPDFDAIYDAHARFVWRAVVRLGVEPGAVDDAVQEIFIAVHRGLRDFEQRSSARTWIYGIAINVARHHRRSRMRKPLGSGESGEGDPQMVPADPAHAPDAVFEKTEAVRLLLRVLDHLSTELREIFVLAELEEMTLAEIADVLATNPNTIASRLRAARKCFDQALARERARDTWRMR